MRQYDFIVAGADGMQGRIVVRDLVENGYTVLATDIVKTQRLTDLISKNKTSISFAYLDLRDIDAVVENIIDSGANVLINCAEGDWNIDAYRACLRARAHCIDLGSRTDMTKHQLAMDRQFRNAELTAITGVGSVPGIGNVMLRHAAKKFDIIDTIEVGFAWDSNIKKFVPPFSMESILEEFMLPAPYIVNGKWRTKPPIATRQTRNFRSIGYQEIFLSDHPETYTFYHYYKKPKLVKNVRFYAGFPEHATKVITLLFELGFGDKKAVDIGNRKVIPPQFVGQLFKRIRMPRRYQEWENLWVNLTGARNKKKKHIVMECLVPTLPGWEDAGCNIDTGMPASIIGQMLKSGVVKNRGSFAPEAVIPEKPFFKELAKRQMHVFENGKRIN